MRVKPEAELLLYVYNWRTQSRELIVAVAARRVTPVANQLSLAANPRTYGEALPYWLILLVGRYAARDVIIAWSADRPMMRDINAMGGVVRGVNEIPLNVCNDKR